MNVLETGESCYNESHRVRLEDKRVDQQALDGLFFVLLRAWVKRWMKSC
jgi:hypothetical protein